MGITKSALAFVGTLALLGSMAWAQDDIGILISTRPPGATLYLYGAHDLVANAPARLPSELSGLYKVKITRPGYENWKGELTLVPGFSNEIDIKLSKKTRRKAMLRSLFIPGWGQMYSGNSLRGSVFTTGVIVSAAAAYLTDRRYQKKRSDYDIALGEYYDAQSIEDRVRLKANLNEKQKTAYDAETDRRTAFVIGAAIWAFNIIDALVFFPEKDVFYPAVTSMEDGVAISVTARF